MASSCGDVAHLLRTAWYTVAAMVLMTTQPFLVMLTKNVDGGYNYAPITTTFLAEFMKLIISFCLYNKPATKRTHNTLTTRDIFQFAVPAFVYFVNNNLIFIILAYVSSTTYQILSSLKTVATGILFRLILKRKLADVQKTAILLLACGAAVSQLPSPLPAGSQTCTGPSELTQLLVRFNASNGSSVEINSDALLAAAADAAAAEAQAAESSGAGGVFIGVSVALFACLNSAFGGVYSELLLKKDGSLHSIHLQNLLLYAWGVLFNFIGLLVKDHELVFSSGIFSGYSAAVWTLVLNNGKSAAAIAQRRLHSSSTGSILGVAHRRILTHVDSPTALAFSSSPPPHILLASSWPPPRAALNGLAISAILKFADNIVRVFAHTAAMLLTMVLELVFMSAPFSFKLLVSITIVMCVRRWRLARNAPALHHASPTHHNAIGTTAAAHIPLPPLSASTLHQVLNFSL